ncbi:MAG: TIM barrel protein, partial [Patescibacteria group bacterium]
VSDARKRKMILTDDECIELGRFNEEHDLTCIVHSMYLDIPWRNDEKDGWLAYPAMRFIKKELKVCEIIGSIGLVIHLLEKNNYTNLEEDIVSLGKIETEALIFLEVIATTPENAFYNTFEHIKLLFDIINKHGLRDKFGLCIDTAHFHSMGVSLKTKNDADVFLNCIRTLNLGEKLIFHLNDENHEIGSGLDKHECLLRGKMWEGIPINDSGLASIVKYIRAYNSVCIFEHGDIDDYENDYGVFNSFLG